MVIFDNLSQKGIDNFSGNLKNLHTNDDFIKQIDDIDVFFPKFIKNSSRLTY